MAYPTPTWTIGSLRKEIESDLVFNRHPPFVEESWQGIINKVEDAMLEDVEDEHSYFRG